MKLLLILIAWTLIVAGRLGYSLNRHPSWWSFWREGFAAGFLGSVVNLRYEPPYRWGRAFGSGTADFVRLCIFLGIALAVFASFNWALR